MTLYNLSKQFQKQSSSQNTVDTGAEIPKELDIFYRQESAFLPEGKTFKDLTDDELKKLKAQYRFDHFVPGIYQGITGVGKMI
jgi:hypothetical protein